MNIGRCKGCGQPIVWIVTTKGKKMPCDPQPVTGYGDHTTVKKDKSESEAGQKSIRREGRLMSPWVKWIRENRVHPAELSAKTDGEDGEVILLGEVNDLAWLAAKVFGSIFLRVDDPKSIRKLDLIMTTNIHFYAMECLARIQKSNSDAAVSTDAMTPLEGETLDKIMKTLFGQEVN